MDTISVIIPTYNSAPTIIQAIESVLNQTAKASEVIVVDDGSNDATKILLQSYIASRQIIYHYQNNQGCGAARNAGLTLATGTYIAFLDADDYWNPIKLEEQYASISKSPECIMCYTDVFLVRPDQTLIRPNHSFIGKPRSGQVLGWLLFHNMITISSVLARRSALEKAAGFTDAYELMMFADYDLWLKIAPLGTFLAIQKPLTYYRTRISITNAEKGLNHKKVAIVFLKNSKSAPTIGLKIAYFTGFIFHSLKYWIRKVLR